MCHNLTSVGDKNNRCNSRNGIIHSGGRLNIKIPSCHYMDSYHKDKTVSRPSCLYNGTIHTWKDRLHMLRQGPWGWCNIFQNSSKLTAKYFSSTSSISVVQYCLQFCQVCDNINKQNFMMIMQLTHKFLANEFLWDLGLIQEFRGEILYCYLSYVPESTQITEVFY